MSARGSPGGPAMAQGGLSPQGFELHMRDLRSKLSAYFERGEGSARQLLKEAENVFALAPQFPEVFARFPEVEGMVADLLARQRQEDVFGSGPARGRPNAPGCMLGWLFRPRKR